MVDDQRLIHDMYGAPVQVRDVIEDLDFPVSKDDLVKAAEAAGVDEDVRALFEDLHEDEFESPLDVYDSLESEEGIR